MCFHEFINFVFFMIFFFYFLYSGNIGKNVSYLKLDKACLMVIKSLELERDYQGLF